MSKLPEYEIYAIRYAKQDKRSEAHMFLGGDQRKLIQGLDFFTYALRGGGRTWIVDTGMTERQAKRMGAQLRFHLPAERGAGEDRHRSRQPSPT